MMCFLTFHSSRMELFLHNLQRVEFMAKIYSWPELNSVLEEALFAMAQVAWSVAYQIWRSKMVLVYSVMNIWTQNFSFFPKFTTENSSEVYYRKFFRSLLPKILPKFTTENSSEVYHQFRRQRKSEEPHKLSLKCESEDKGVANVMQKSCS